MKTEVPQEIRDLIDLIDKKYAEAKEAKVSRFSVEWSKWSREMNVELRKKDDILSKYVTVYWTLKSQMLEMFFKHPSKWVKMGRKKRKQKEIVDIKEIILTGNVLGEGNLTDTELQRLILQNK